MNGNCTMETKVTSINGWFHCRLYVNGELFHEMACERRDDIGSLCRQMMYDADKYFWVVEPTHACSSRTNDQRSLAEDQCSSEDVK